MKRLYLLVEKSKTAILKKKTYLKSAGISEDIFIGNISCGNIFYTIIFTGSYICGSHIVTDKISGPYICLARFN